MGRYDIIVKTEEIRRRVQEGDFDSAQKIMDTMVLKKVKNIADLSLFADVYIQNENYDEAMELLYRVYKKSKTRRTLYQIVHASIGRKNIEEAERYLKEYEEAAPNDYNIFIFRYKIDKAKKEPYIILIDSLKKLKNYTYMEKWAYELAKLYYKAGMEKECIQECSDLILWFGEGSYVEKAKILKAYYSGEVDKDEIIENLKNRAANAISSDTENNSKDENTNDESSEEGNYQEENLKEENSENEKSIELSPLQTDKEESLDFVHEGSDDDFENLVKIHLHDGPEDKVLDELAESVGKEVDSLMTREQEIRDNSKPLKEEATDIFQFTKKDDKNEDLERLEKLSENLNIDINQIFGNFIHVKSLQKQLVKSLELIMNKHTKSVQMIITGAPSSGKTTLAKDIAIFLNRTGKLKTSRIAKISAFKLNEIDITNMKGELRNSCLVIENASELKKPTIDKLLELIRYFHGEIAVIFEENKKNMNRLFRECPKLMELFKNRIHLPAYTEEDLLGFAYSYIILREYKVQPVALDVLRDGVIEIIENTEKEKRLESISKYVQNAMTSADLRTGKQLPKLAAEGRLADADILSLLPEDFTYQITT
ncbi:MAG: tetratricopeptide repeat protein [Anaerolineaceae bacterium]|nr:MAG: tetratricopeptide repeat protein [Anaerolineaceae bacterium]